MQERFKKHLEYDNLYVGNIKYSHGGKVFMDLEFYCGDKTLSYKLKGLLQISDEYKYNEKVKLRNHSVVELFEEQSLSEIIRNGIIYDTDDGQLKQNYKLTPDIIIDDDDWNLIFCIGEVDTSITDGDVEDEMQEDSEKNDEEFRGKVLLKFSKETNNFNYLLSPRQKLHIQNRLCQILN